jgi:hypothetical protein
MPALKDHVRCAVVPSGSLRLKPCLGCLRRFVFIEVAATLDCHELRLVARRSPPIAENFRASGPVGVASTKYANHF